MLRDAPWLEGERAVAWARVLSGVTVGGTLLLLAISHFGVLPDPWHRPLGSDFVSFWTAGRLALDGHAASAWDPFVHGPTESLYFPAARGFQDNYYAFFYPPPFLLICVPLALLPYSAALITWLCVTSLACYSTVRALLPARWSASLAFLAFPAVPLNAGHGQNGALTAALMGTAALTMDRRPRVAGICLGALCFKPQLAILLAPMLIAARRWQVLAWAAVSVSAMCVASLLAFGLAAWHAFFAALPTARAAMEYGLVGFGKMVSPFAAIRLGGLDLGIAWTVPALVAGVVLIIAIAAVRRRRGGSVEAAIFAAGALLVRTSVFKRA